VEAVDPRDDQEDSDEHREVDVGVEHHLIGGKLAQHHCEAPSELGEETCADKLDRARRGSEERARRGSKESEEREGEARRRREGKDREGRYIPNPHIAVRARMCFLKEGRLAQNHSYLPI
jgi:hypothetical protein